MQNTEAIISIYLPTLAKENETEQTVYATMMQVELNGEPYTGPLYANKILLEDSNDFVLLVADRDLNAEEARTFYDELMEYHQGIDHNLSEEELAVRDEEVRTKWLNGNFNWWGLGSGKIEAPEEDQEFAGISYCGSGCAKCRCKE